VRKRDGARTSRHASHTLSCGVSLRAVRLTVKHPSTTGFARSQRDQTVTSIDHRGEFAVLGRTLCTLILIGFAVWLGWSWSGYARRYAQATEGWHVGGTELVELTLIGDDIHNLSCASDVVIEGLRCAYRPDGRTPGPEASDDRHQLRPYNTVKHELLLGAGLWSAPALTGSLPPGRFSVVCNFNVRGVVKSASLRFAPTGSFTPLKRSVAVGTLTECVIPQ
jgi:hypothetical protein